MQAKKTFDPNSPEIKAYLHELKHGQFTREGMMVAFPTCLPGMTMPITHDESRITALDIAPEGHIYGGTSGRSTHLFGAAFHSLTGIVFDAGTVEGATRCEAVCCGASRAIAFVNGSRGGRAVALPYIELDQDLIQEWGFETPVLSDLGECAAGEPVVHAITDRSRAIAVAATSRHIVTVDFKSGKISSAAEAPGKGRLGLGSRGGIFGQDDGDSLWRFEPASSEVRRRAVKLPPGNWSKPMQWGRDSRTGVLYTADAEGRLFSFEENAGLRAIGRAPLDSVVAMAVAPDGRLFGFCGEEMANMFCWEPGASKVSNLGVAASVIERRRYGYQFGDAVTGRDGEIVFGEDDNGGHLWLYFPKIRAAG